ncbi:hypothetical protein BH11BAC6_BH11BAC6_00330 [soil metagenome]
MLTIIGGEAKGVVATVLLTESNEDTESKANGSFELKSGFTGTATVTISADGLQTKNISQNIDGTGNIDLGEITLVV